MLLRILIVATLLAVTAVAQAAEEWIKLGGMDVAVWTKQADTAGKQPVIVFSHGFHGCATQSRFLMEAFAAAGYIIFAPNHRDATCHGGASSWRDPATAPFKQAELWTESSYRDRADDLRNLIEAIKKDPRFSNRADMSRLALAGHSLGGYTVLGLAGAWPGWKLAGVKAVLALSPYSQPFVLHDTLRGLSAPVMYQGGTRDFGITPTIHKSMGSYDLSPPPKYYVEFDKAGHFAWTDIGLTARDAIISYSVAFLDHYVKGEPASPRLTQTAPGVALMRYASELGSADVRSGN